MEQTAPFEIQVAISDGSNSEKSANFYPIDITIVNESSVGFKSAEVAVKDNDSNRVATAVFGSIPSGGEDRRTVQLPGGIELCIWKIVPDIGDTISGFGAAGNAPGVKLTITD